MTFLKPSLCCFLVVPAFLLAMATITAQAQTKASCTFKLFPLPESRDTSAPYGVNDRGTVVGAAVSNSGIERAFARTASGTVTYYRAPNTVPDYASFTYFTGRNDAGVSVGIYKVPNPNLSVPEGFILNGSSFTPVLEPKSVWGTNANGINKWNTVVGYYFDYRYHTHGFKRLGNGSFITLNYPGAQNTLPAGINDHGVVVGTYFPGGNGFVYYNGRWATLNYPKAAGTNLNGISDAGVIIGRSTATKQGTAFLYANGVFKVIAVPNAFLTNAVGISADGLITGTTNLDGTLTGWHGFTAICH